MIEPLWAAGAARSSGREPVRSYDALIEIATQIHAEEFNADAVLRLVVDRARELLATDLAWLALAEGDHVRVRIAAGATTPGIGRMEVALGTGIGGIALREGRTVIVGDQALYGNGMPSTVHEALEAEGVVSVMCAPMLRDGQMVGALYVASREATVFDDAERAALAFAEEGTRLADAHTGVSDDTWALVRKHYDDEQAAALVCLVALINAANRINVIARTPAGSYEPGMFAAMAG